jgi:hypothetical protein
VFAAQDRQHRLGADRLLFIDSGMVVVISSSAPLREISALPFSSVARFVAGRLLLATRSKNVENLLLLPRLVEKSGICDKTRNICAQFGCGAGNAGYSKDKG